MSEHTRKLVYYVATSVDHYIAHEDESIDGFVASGAHVDDYLASLAHYDTVLMGRRTYEWGYRFGLAPGAPVPTYQTMQQYVFSTTLTFADQDNIHFIAADADAFVNHLKQQPGGAIYLCGGGQLAGALLTAQLIDEVILKVNPVLFGQGIALFGNQHRRHALTLLDSKTYNNGVLFLHYAITR